MLNNNTICAIATAPGGAIGIIRISGPKAINIADRIFRPVGSTLSLSEHKAYTLAFGNIVNANNDVVDEVLVSIFRARGLRRDFVPWLSLCASAGYAPAHREWLHSSRTWRVHPTCLP